MRLRTARLPTAILLIATFVGVASCTATADGGDGAPAPLASDTSGGTAATADTLPPVLRPLSLEDLPPGDGPLFPFADSSAGQARWGLRDAVSRIVVAPRYHYTTPMFEGRAAVAMEGQYGVPRWGYVDARGELVIAMRFDGAGFFAGGRAPVLRGDDYALIDSTGAIVERLASARDDALSPTLPEPCDSCTLGEYARRLPRTGEPLHLYVQPVVGESFRRIAIVRHPGDLLSVAEGGWEHWVHELRVPGLSLEQGLALARRIMGAGQFVELRDEDDAGAIVLRSAGARVHTGNEEMRVRVRGGVLEVVHSDGS